MKLAQIAYGLTTHLPGFNRLRLSMRGTGGTDSASYCYSVWMRHMVMAHMNGLDTGPRVIAELGPGDSLGIGLAALISGCHRYLALDIVEYANRSKNLAIFEALLEMFANRSPIPDEDEWPGVKPLLEDYSFPEGVFPKGRLEAALSPSRIERIRESIRDPGGPDSVIRYMVPWYEDRVIEPGQVDWIYSQAVLEHVDDLSGAYRAMYSWLKPGGTFSHTIDFKCHKTASEWNGHWTYSDSTWKLIKGKRPYLINRVPHSEHVSLMQECGFEILCDKQTTMASKVTPDDLALRFANLSAEDLHISGTYIMGIKPPEQRFEDFVLCLSGHT